MCNIYKKSVLYPGQEILYFAFYLDFIVYPGNSDLETYDYIYVTVFLSTVFSYKNYVSVIGSNGG